MLFVSVGINNHIQKMLSIKLNREAKVPYPFDDGVVNAIY